LSKFIQRNLVKALSDSLKLIGTRYSIDDAHIAIDDEGQPIPPLNMQNYFIEKLLVGTKKEPMVIQTEDG
jgi:hypothetical protein